MISLQHGEGASDANETYECVLVQAQRRRSPSDAQALPKPLGPLPGSLTSPRHAKHSSRAGAGAEAGDTATRQSQDAVVPQIQPTGEMLRRCFCRLTKSIHALQSKYASVISIAINFHTLIWLSVEHIASSSLKDFMPEVCNLHFLCNSHARVSCGPHVPILQIA